jgi:phage RecT family recombinase
MSTALQKPPAKLRDWLTAPSIKHGIESALAGYMQVDSFVAQMLIAFQDDALADCTPESKFEACHQCATLGLLPSLKHVALIPREIKNKGKCVTVMPQWQGYQALMLRHPEVSSIRASLVHVRDKYTYDPLDESLFHEFDPFDESRTISKLDDIRGGYLRVMYKDGRPTLFHYVTKETIRKAMACAQSKNIWEKWFAEMALKTVYRNAYARRVVPVDHLVYARLQAITDADDIAMENAPLQQIVVQSNPVIDGPKQSRVEQAAAKMQKPKPEPAVETKEESTAVEESSAAVVVDTSEGAIAAATTAEQLDAIMEALKANKEALGLNQYDMLYTIAKLRRKDLAGKK